MKYLPLIFVVILSVGCTTAQNKQIEQDDPKLAGLTAAVEKFEAGMDNAATAVQKDLPVIQAATNAAVSTGVPYSSYAQLIEIVLGGIATFWLGHRHGAMSTQIASNSAAIKAKAA